MPSRTDMEEVIGHWIATTTAAMKLAWQDPHTATECRVRQRAHEYIAEANLFEWLTKQNSKGVAPSSWNMVTQLDQDWLWNGTHKVNNLPNTLLTGSESTRRTWAQRFRAWWGLKIGKLPVAPDISPLEIKIQTCIKIVTPLLVQKTTPIQGSHIMFLYSGRSQKRSQN